MIGICWNDGEGREALKVNAKRNFWEKGHISGEDERKQVQTESTPVDLIVVRDEGAPLTY